MITENLTIGLIGPLPPPSGGMANQTLQLARLLRTEGITVELVQMNAPYRPQWIKHFKGIRALFRLLPYLMRLWKTAGKVRLFHVMANSGWSWHLFAAPAVWVASLRGTPVIVNYRGGEAKTFFSSSISSVAPTLRRTNAIIVPSRFLQQIFEKFNFTTHIVPNIINLERFHYREPAPSHAPKILVARNLEPIYDNATALHAFHIILERYPAATLTVAGSGPERAALEQLSLNLGIANAVTFTGRVENENMPLLYSDADVFVNPSLADNMPISVLEALATGVPVVSTNVGGVPFLVEDGKTAFLVPAENPGNMAKAVLDLLDNPETAIRMSVAGLECAQQFSWQNVKERLMNVYHDVLTEPTKLQTVKQTKAFSPYTAIVSGILFPLHERLKNHTTVPVHRAMETSQWWGTPRLRDLQLARLKALLRHSNEHIPYYRELFKRIGFNAEQVSCLSDLARLPLLTKADIRAHTEELKADDAKGLARFNTGGSSGEPLIFFIGSERVSHDVAAKWRATRWWGVDIGDPEIVVWGSPIELGSQDRIKALRDKVLRTRLLPAFEMSASRLDKFIAEIRATRPKMLFGYPSALTHIAQHAKMRGVRMNDLGIEVAFVTSEALYDHQRKEIGATFGCPVANGYGGRDAGFIAHQCPSGNMHITAEDIIVEIIDANGNLLPAGEPGEIVVTHLATRDFPFIRYRTGDVGVLDDQPCACGRGLPLIKEIQGRTTDFVVAQDGTVMHGLALIYILRDLPGMKQFKIIQESLDLTRIQMATDDAFLEESCSTIVTGVRARLGQKVTVEIERVAEVPEEASGKFRYVVSKLPATYSTASERNI